MVFDHAVSIKRIWTLDELHVLSTGKKMFLVAPPTAQGLFAAQRVMVEKDGLAPPLQSGAIQCNILRSL